MKVSVITVTLNNIKGLLKTYDSLRFLKSDYEWIVIDGGSEDGTVKWLNQQDDVNLRWISEPDSGMCDAMNKGWHLSVGKWVYFLNGGDFLIRSFDHILDFYPEEDMITGRVKICMPDGNITEKIVPGLDWERENFTSGNHIVHQATLLRRDLLEKYGPYDLNYPIVADFEYWIRLHVKGARIKFVDDVFAAFLLGGRSTQRCNFLQMQTERRAVLRAYGYINKLTSFLMGTKLWCKFYLRECLEYAVHSYSSGRKQILGNTTEKA
ncbi:MAG: glycosyltransferase family 2 protein [Pseudomonadota bacterium]